MAVLFWITSRFLDVYLLLFALAPFGKSPYPLEAFPLEGCRDKEINLLMVADGSIPITDQQEFFTNILDYFQAPEEDALTRLKVALVVASPTFGPVLHFSFDTHDSTDQLKKHISELLINYTKPIEANVSQFSVGHTMDFVCSFNNGDGNVTQEGRPNSTNVAIMAVGTSWPNAVEEIQTLHASKSAVCDFQIFLIFVGFNLKDSTKLEIAQSKGQFHADVLGIPRAMPIKLCNECAFYDWSMWHDSLHSLRSCYFYPPVFKTTVSWLEASNNCAMYGGLLVSVETPEELLYLSATLKEFLNESLSNGGGSVTFEHLHIGLDRDSSKTGSPFMWVNGNPVVYTNWRNGLPQGGPSLRCGMWVFKKGSLEDNAPITLQTEIDEGWLDVGCGFSLSSLGLCEIVIKINSRDKLSNALKSSPAGPDSVLKAITRGEFTFFEDKLVSMPAYVQDSAYNSFLKGTKSRFKVFDCAEQDDKVAKIPYSYVCDHIRHCENGRDETICQYPKCDPTKEFTCRSLQCVALESRCDVYKDCYDGSDEENCGFCNAHVCCDGSCLPRSFVANGEVDCNGCDYGFPEGWWMTKNDESDFGEDREPFDCPFVCNRSECVYTYMLNNNVTDCLGPEGPLDETIGKLETIASCNISGRYVRWSPRCVYVKDRFGAVIGCRDMSHLHACQDFICPEGYVKCPDSYCLPLHFVGDGIKDCPMGEDERDLEINCTGNFACWGGKVCVHPDLVCDGHPHCPSGDDELNCHVSCADGFQCKAGTVTVTDYDKSKPLKDLSFIDSRTRYVDLSGVDLSSSIKDGNRGRFLNLIELRLSNCNLRDVDGGLVYDVRKLATVYALDLSRNGISSITTDNMFIYLTNLHFLDLSHNKLLTSLPEMGFYPPHFDSVFETLNLAFTGLTTLKSTFFLGLSNLKYLNLSNTQLDIIDKNTFPENVHLYFLDLRKTQLSDIQPNALTGLSVSQNLYSDLFKLCCPQVRGDGIADNVCHAPPSAISSCSDLVREPVQRVLLWTVGVLAILGNVVVIVYRLMHERDVLKKACGLFVTNLSASDLLMGVYLLIIASSDMVYRGEYVWHESVWRNSVLCQAAGFLSTLSSETSAFFIVLVTIDRFLVMRFPLGQIKFSRKCMNVSCIVAWSVGFLLALIPVLPSFSDWQMYSSNGMCLGLPLSPQRHSGWEYSVLIFIVLNFLLFIFIACGQYLIYRAITDNSMTVSSEALKNSRRLREIMVAKQLSLVALSDFLCWFPIGLMGLLALSGRDIGTEAYAWSAVLVLPINSALNPVLYTVPLIMKKWETFKSGLVKPPNTKTTNTS